MTTLLSSNVFSMPCSSSSPLRLMGNSKLLILLNPIKLSDKVLYTLKYPFSAGHVSLSFVSFWHKQQKFQLVLVDGIVLSLFVINV